MVDMAKAKFDGVVEAVHYAPDGQVDWVRVYQRRGPTFSDRILLDRPSLIKLLKSGKRYVIGERKILLASTFETSSALKVIQKGGQDLIVAGEASTDHDSLGSAPLI